MKISKKILVLPLLAIGLLGFTNAPTSYETIEIPSNNNLRKLAFIEESDIDFDISPDFEEDLIKNFGLNYKEALKKNEKSAEIAGKITMKYLNEKTGKIEYPSDFGGQYINENNELVVQIVKDAEVEESIKSVASLISKDIIFEYVNNSNNDLENVNNTIIKYLTTDGVEKRSHNANYIDVQNNIVVVELKNNSKEEQEWFKNTIIDSPLIKFVENDTKVSDTTTYNAGGDLAGVCSIGYRAKRSNTNGFVTAAHCYSNNTNISGYGQVKQRVFDLSNGLDGEWVQLSSGNSVTNTIQWNVYPTHSISTSTNYYQVYVTGAAIAKSGMRTHATSGTITNVNYTYTTNGTTAAKFVLTNAICNNGDSGGLVYKPSLNSSVSGTTAGVVHAKECTDTACANPGPMLFSRSDYLDSSLSLTRY